MLEEELQLAIALADEAGHRALALQAGGPAVLQTTEKPEDQGPVTRADLELNAYLVTALSRAFPNDGIHAEESPPDDRWHLAPRVWHLDPIDGTRAFARGHASWAVHIGLSIEGRAVLGVVHQPATRTMVFGVVDTPRFAQAIVRTGDAGRPAQLSSRPLDDARIVTSRLRASRRFDAVLSELAIPPDRVGYASSTGVKLATLVCGEAELVIHPRRGPKLWDTCAPGAVLRAAGGRITSLLGEELRFDDPTGEHHTGVLAAPPALHEAVLQRLGPLASGWFGASGPPVPGRESLRA